MRALFLNHNVVRTGTYYRCAGFARELVALGHDVVLMTTSRDRRGNGQEFDVDGVHVIEAPDVTVGPARTGWDPWNTAWRMRRLAHESFDVIHAFDARPAVIVPALAVRKRTRAPLFLDWADWWGRGGTIEERSGWMVRTLFGPVETWFEESFRPGATANTAIIETLRERCIALGVEPARVIALPNGCVPPPARPIERAHARRQLELGAEPLLLHLGAAFRADATFLFDAFRRVRRVVPDARLALIGRFRHDVPDDLREAIHRVGFVEENELELWLAAANAAVLVLRDTIASRGRWPGKLSDYLSAGVPIVLPRVGAAAEHIGAAGAAVLSEPSPASLAAHLVAVLRDPELQERLAVRARQLASGELAWPRVTARLLEFYEQFGVQVHESARLQATVS